MKKDTFSNRLKIAMDKKNYKQMDLVKKTKIDKTLINKYLKGISEAKHLFILYLSLLYTQSKIIKSTINLISNILLLSISDKEKIKEIKKEIDNISEDISDDETIKIIKDTVEMTKNLKDDSIKYFLLSNQRKKMYKKEYENGNLNEKDYKNILNEIAKIDSESLAGINSKIILLDDELNKKAKTNHQKDNSD